jgi:hypothetical protein
MCAPPFDMIPSDVEMNSHIRVRNSAGARKIVFDRAGAYLDVHLDSKDTRSKLTNATRIAVSRRLTKSGLGLTDKPRPSDHHTSNCIWKCLDSSLVPSSNAAGRDLEVAKQSSLTWHTLAPRLEQSKLPTVPCPHRILSAERLDGRLST